ncbi:VG15 protein [Corynebacterium jeikeium]|uniref:VG15 protein n=1 Tax=Corynebacterium jeikeium TaxID=38289 RepID=UPI00088BEC47|nr:EndoU domain-containing protein [Corynebacterium jeikeium]SCX06811.1 hypothetical protein CJBVI_0513 [Corynebacterium jeikeium]
MPSDLAHYKYALGVIEKAALRRLEDWWTGTNRFNHDPKVLLDLYREPFSALVQAFGAQAAQQAVTQLILTRSLDDELRFLPTPTAAEVAKDEQIQLSLQWALNTAKAADGEFAPPLAKTKLQGVLNRLVLQPARDTMVKTCERDGTGYARIPEPGACHFCLMLASRGAVYAKDTVVTTNMMSRYHDHCRCLGIEAPRATTKNRFAGLPPVNEQLRQMWDANVGAETKKDWTSLQRRQQWRNLIIHKRREKTGSDAPVRWPPLPGITTPKYTLNASYSTFGKVEPLPALDKMPGHVLFGWTDNDKELPKIEGDSVPDYGREAHTRGDQQGHRYGSQRPGATMFPKEWSDQKIVDAVRDTIETPDLYMPLGGNAVPRRVRKNVDGVLVEAEWIFLNGEAHFRFAMPIRGKGVTMINKQNKIVDATDRMYHEKQFQRIEKNL